ncbi:hypothetical protein FG386_000556 [Cryptosporidium ryanae]|uniref:uncharacterized protein n=1 Tax=Cryptosporidium ryanae TaxID=515981 RepID=UPI003519E0F0|nr:hypothetical protein FG386_000556 [Cryptosporidium ryanae]
MINSGIIGPTCIIVAHPDDESLFFTPIINFLNKENNLYLLCLTNGMFSKHFFSYNSLLMQLKCFYTPLIIKGNFYGLGKEREKELINSCKLLGIKEDNVKIVNNELIQDQPHDKWELSVVISEIESFIDSNKIETVFTFDEFGVSKHINHISVNESILKWLNDSKRSCYPSIYVLLSCNLLIKYSGMLSWIYCFFSNNNEL